MLEPGAQSSRPRRQAAGSSTNEPSMYQGTGFLQGSARKGEWASHFGNKSSRFWRWGRRGVQRRGVGGR